MRRMAILAGFALAACGLTTEPIDQIELGLAVEPQVFAGGDSIRFIATAFNPTDETVQIGRECGPSFDVLAKMPDGSEISVLRERNPGGMYTCQLGSWHFADPGETERLELPWRVPLTPGGYEAVAVLRRPESTRSAPLRFTVQ